MSEFDRRLPKPAVDIVRDLSKKNCWMRNLLRHWAPSGKSGALRLAIRNGYMNFYSCGQSIGKVRFGRGGRRPSLEIHKKYVCRRASGQEYFKIAAEEGLDPDGLTCPWDGARMLDRWIANSKCYRSVEKRHIDALLAVWPKVIDLEIGLPAFDGRRRAPRVDMVALEDAPGGARIVFWEAKMIGDSRIRSNSSPEVFQQIDSYEAFLADPCRRRRIAEAYREHCRLLGEFCEIVSAGGKALHPFVRWAAKPGCQLNVDCRPRLVIFDDGGKRRRDVWQRHLRKLRRRVPVAVVESRV